MVLSAASVACSRIQQPVGMSGQEDDDLSVGRYDPFPAPSFDGMEHLSGGLERVHHQPGRDWILGVWRQAFVVFLEADFTVHETGCQVCD